MNFERVAAALALAATAAAAPWPAAAHDPLLAHCTSIRMIVPYTAGGGGDTGARLLAPYMAEDLGIPIHVENLPGAGSQIGVTELTQAPADGCTIGWTHLPAVITIYNDPTRQAAFNRESLAPVAMYVIDPGGLAVKGDSPYNSLDDLIAAAKADPAAISISDSGVLSDGHLLLLELQRLSGADFAIVHGGGGAEGNADLLGGHVTAQTINLSGANLALSQSGQIKVIALFTPEEVPRYPGVTTATAQGFPILSSTSRGLSVPAGTPAPVVERLSQAVGRAMESPRFLEQAAAMGLPLAYMDEDEMADYWSAMETTFAPLIAQYAQTQ